MTYDLDSFETDTAKVWYGGTHLLPSVADDYADLSEKVWMTRDTADDKFAGGNSPSGYMSTVYSAWDGLRGEFQNILAETSKNMNKTGKALVTLANEIAENDTDAKGEIDGVGNELDVDVSDPKGTDAGDPDFTDSHETVPGQPQI